MAAPLLGGLFLLVVIGVGFGGAELLKAAGVSIGHGQGTIEGLGLLFLIGLAIVLGVAWWITGSIRARRPHPSDDPVVAPPVRRPREPRI
jgi:hypothetical protein